jgi:hypothetical protein
MLLLKFAGFGTAGAVRRTRPFPDQMTSRRFALKDRSVKLVRALLFLAIALAAVPAFGQYQAVNQLCVAEAWQTAVTSAPPANLAGDMFPGCTVKVYNTGTTTLTTIYSTATGGTKSNPFSADSTGRWLFYVSPTACYDIVLSGGSPAYPAPLTIPNVCPGQAKGAVLADLFPASTDAFLGSWAGEGPALQSLQNGGRVVIGPQGPGTAAGYPPSRFVDGSGALQTVWSSGTMIEDQRYGEDVRVAYNPFDTSIGNGSAYFGYQSVCNWDTLTKDYGGAFSPSTMCNASVSSISVPGFSFGNANATLYPGSQGWLKNTAHNLTMNCLTSGICSALSATMSHYGLGDTNTIDILTNTKWGATAASDEGVNGIRSQINEVFNPYGGAISALAASGSQTAITVSTPSNTAYLGPAQPLVDTTSASKISATQQLESGGTASFAKMVLSGTGPLPVSVCSTILNPVTTGIPDIYSPSTANISSWKAAAPSGGLSIFTFTYSSVSGPAPVAGNYVYLSGFTSSSTPAGLNGTVVEIASVSGSDFTAQVFYNGAAIGPTSETSAQATLWTPGRIPSGGTSTMTVTVKSPTTGAGGFNATDLIFIEDVFPEQTVPAAAPVVQADGSVVLTLPLRFQHAPNAWICQGGLAGYRVNMTDYSGSISTYVQYVTGSVSTTEIREGYVAQGSLTAFAYNSAVTIMPGTDVVSVRNPTTGNVDGSTFVIEPAPAFAVGDTIMEPNNIAGGATGMNLVTSAFSPYAAYQGMNLQWPGASLPQSYGMTINFQGDQEKDVVDGYPGIISQGGVLNPPTMIRALGVAKNVLDISLPPDNTLLNVGGCRDTAYVGNRMYNLWAQSGTSGGVSEGASLSYYPCTSDTSKQHTLFLNNAGFALGGSLSSGDLSASSVTARGALSVANSLGGTSDTRMAEAGQWNQMSFGWIPSGSTGPYTEQEFLFQNAYANTLAMGHNVSGTRVNDLIFGGSQGIGIGSGTTAVPVGSIALGSNVMVNGTTGVVKMSALTASSVVCTDGSSNLSTSCSGKYLAPANNLSDVSSTATARANLGIASGENVVTYSATPTFSPSYGSNLIVLTGSISSFTLAGGLAGQHETLVFCQDGSGSHTVSPPGNVHGFFTVGSTAGTCSSQSFVWSASRSAWLADSLGVTNE